MSDEIRIILGLVLSVLIFFPMYLLADMRATKAEQELRDLRNNKKKAQPKEPTSD